MIITFSVSTAIHETRKQIRTIIRDFNRAVLERQANRETLKRHAPPT
jgi:hypothetical protein